MSDTGNSSTDQATKLPPTTKLPPNVESRFDLEATALQIRVFTGEDDPEIDWRLAPESKGQKERLGRLSKEERARLRLKYRGRLSERTELLKRKNAAGYAVYLLPNETDGKGAKKENITAARVLSLDLDGAPLPKTWKVEPHLIEETSPGRFQVFWSIQPTADISAVENIAKRLAVHYKGDPRCADITHVFRAAGFVHQKGKLFQSRIISHRDPDFDRLSLGSFSFLPELPEIADTESAPAAGTIDAGKADLLLQHFDAADFASTEAEGDKAWLNLAMSLHDGSNGDPDVRDRFLEFCRTDPEYDTEADEAANWLRWDSFRTDKSKRVTIGTLHKICSDYGVPADVMQEVFGNDPREDFEWLEGEETSASRSANGLSYVMASEVTPEKVVWLWPNRVAVGKVNFIGGAPDQGKSQITCDVAARVTQGGDWPNREGKAEKGSVVILSSEDDIADTIVPRLIAAGADVSKVAIVRAVVKGTDKKGQRMFNIAEDLGRLNGLVKEIGDVRLVIVDPISAFMGGKTTADTYKNTEVRAVLGPLADWAASRELAVLFISHFNKNGSGRALSRLTDSLAFGALARCGWFALPEENETGETGRRLFLKGKNNLGPDIGGLAYTIEQKAFVTEKGERITAPFIKWDGPVTITADQALAASGMKPSAIDLAETFLEDVLANGPLESTKIKKLAEGKGYGWRTVRRAQSNLGVIAKHRGFTKNSGWWWRLPDIEADEFG